MWKWKWCGVIIMIIVNNEIIINENNEIMKKIMKE